MADPLRVVLGTRNEDKVREIKHILRSLPIQLLSLRDFPEVGPVEEDGTTFEENAIKKAMHVWQHTRMASLADDSGLEVKALRGMPGVMSARFAGENASYQDNNRKLIRMLEGVSEEERKASFVCVAVLVTPKGKMVLQRGELTGVIIDESRGSGGFGYDPIFYIPRLKKTVSELGEDVKNTVSHRAKAFGALRDFIAALAASGC